MLLMNLKSLHQTTVLKLNIENQLVDMYQKHNFNNLYKMKKIKDNEHLILIFLLFIILGILLLAYDYSKTNTFESYGMLLIRTGANDYLG